MNEELINLFGFDTAMQIMRVMGGQEVYIANDINNPTLANIRQIIGDKETQKLINTYWGARIYIPSYQQYHREQRNTAFIKAVDTDIQAGMSKTQAVKQQSRLFGFSDRNGWNIYRNSLQDFDEWE